MSFMGVYVYVGATDVAKCRPKGRFGSRQPQVHDRRNHIPVVY
jgi:hypothetical protein